MLFIMEITLHLLWTLYTPQILIKSFNETKKSAFILWIDKICETGGTFELFFYYLITDWSKYIN